MTIATKLVLVTEVAVERYGNFIRQWMEQSPFRPTEKEAESMEVLQALLEGEVVRTDFIDFPLGHWLSQQIPTPGSGRKEAVEASRRSCGRGSCMHVNDEECAEVGRYMHDEKCSASQTSYALLCDCPAIYDLWHDQFGGDPDVKYGD